MDGTVLVVGAGLAGSRCAETLRAEGFEGRVVLAGDEPVPPYERPALSKGILTGERPAEAIRLRPDGYWAERSIVLAVSTRVLGIDTSARVALTADGRTIGWTALVLATGARARRPFAPLPRGAHVLRTLADAVAFREELRPGRRIAVVGAGFTGGEAATAAAALGSDVVVVDAHGPLARALGPEVSRELAERYHDHGIELVTGARLSGFRTGPEGRLRGLLLDDGSELACDAALLAVGVDPLVPPGAPGDAAGIPTDACGRTALPDVYACGDAALAWHPWLGRPFRADHWTAAAGQGVSVAHAVLGNDRPYADPPYFWSDQVGLRLQCVGDPLGCASADLEGEPDSFEARYHDREGGLVAALFANRPREAATLRRELAA